jgi:hypothetical protein
MRKKKASARRADLLGLTIGRKDKADFPKLGLENVDVKVDTGAYTASIHCHNIRVVTRRGKTRVTFSLLDPRHRLYNNKELDLPVAGWRRVKNSFGQTEDRVTVKTSIRMFDRLFGIELALTDRKDMSSPVLLGRKFLRRGFLVDVNRYNVSFRQKLRKGKNR